MKKGLKMSLKWENIMSKCGLHTIDLILTHLDSYWGHVQCTYRVSQKKWCIAISYSRVVLDDQRLIKLTDT